MNYEKFIALSQQFLNQLNSNLSTTQFNLEPHWNIDHICYRTVSNDQYLNLKNDFSSFSTELIESEVNGRLITTFKLFEPIKFNNNIIQLVELPAPKASKIVPEGFEHIEVVCDISFDGLKSKLKNHKLNESGLSKSFNPELAVDLNGSNIKFHHISLESVVTLEANKPVYNSLLDSEILNKFKSYNPQVVGTFPLGITTESSDVDIIMETNNLHLTSKQLVDHCSEFNNFTYQPGVLNNNNYILFRFHINNIPFEIFVQNLPVYEQQAFKHFQIEERLLKMGNDTIKQKIIEFRNSGLKNEPAFAKALNINGDPYLSLLELSYKTEQELIDILKSVNNI